MGNQKERRFLLFIVPAVMLTLVYPAFADDGAELTTILQSLYPAAKIQKRQTWRSQGKLAEILLPIYYNRQPGLIPLSKARIVCLSEKTAVVAFESYYAPTLMELDSSLVKGQLHPDGKYRKIIQVLVVSRTDHANFSRLSDFPIESESWSCQGDICAVPTLSMIKNEGEYKGGFIVSVCYSKGYEHLIQFFSIDSTSSLPVSSALPAFDMSRETGCSITATYQLQLKSNSITKVSICEGDNCKDVCNQLSIKYGKDTTQIPLTLK
jgi:hypothetical protein